MEKICWVTLSSSTIDKIFKIIEPTFIMINKGMINKGKYWIFEKNNGAPVPYFGDIKGTQKGFQYSISFWFELSCLFC